MVYPRSAVCGFRYRAPLGNIRMDSGREKRNVGHASQLDSQDSNG